MIRKTAVLINDFSGGEDTRTPIISMGLNKSPNMRNFHCAGVGSRLIKRGGFDKVNSSTVESDGIDVYYPPGYQTYDYPLRTTAAYTQISQGFKPNTSSTVTKVKLWLKKTGTPAGTDTITLTIQTDSSGVPSGSAVTNGASIAVDISDTTGLVTTGYSWVTFTFTSNPTLVAGTQYHLVLSGAYTVSEVNYITWGVDNYDVIYADGVMSVYDATTWVTDPLYNACFEVYITGGAKGNDGVAVWDFSSKNMFLGIFGTTIYKMDKNAAGTPDGVWDAVSGGAGTWDSYTKLVLHLDNNVTDSATGKTVTNSNVTFTNTGGEFKFGYSAVFNGTTAKLTLDDSDDWNFGNGDFCLETWIKRNGVGVREVIFWQANSGGGAGGFILQIDADNKVTGYITVGGALKGVTSTGTINTAWHHIAMVRYGNTITLYLDGNADGTLDVTGMTIDDSTLTLYIGCSVNDNWLAGKLDEIRISKGTPRFTANFTPPTSAYSASATPLTSSRFWTMADWQSGRALVNTDIGLYTYIGTGNVSAVSAAPIGKFTTIWKKYVFMAGIRGSPNTVRYSDLSDYTTWTAANTLNFDTSDGDVITGIRILRGKMYVFKRYSIFRVTYLGSNPAFQVDQVSGIGCPSHFTIKEVDMSGEIGTVLIFLTTDKKLAIFDGYNIQIISDVLTEETNDLFASADDQPLSFSDMNFKYVDLFHAQVKTDTSEYILYCILGTDTAVNYAFVFDYKTGGIYPYDGQIFASSCYALSTDKIKKLYCSGYTGYTWLQESGNSDDSSAINAYWVSGKMKQASIALLNKNLLLGINVKEITSSSTINIAMQYRFDWNVSWTTAQNFSFNHNDELAFGKTVMFDIGSISNMFQVKLKDNSTNPAPTIYSLEMYGSEIPLGVSPMERATV